MQSILKRWPGVLAVLVASGVAAPPASAEMTEAQRNLLRQSSASVRAAGTAYRDGQYVESAKQLVAAAGLVDEALSDADADVFERAASLLNSIEGAHALLQLEGVVLPPFERPEYGQSWTNYANASAIDVTGVVPRGPANPAPNNGSLALTPSETPMMAPMSGATPAGPSAPTGRPMRRTRPGRNPPAGLDASGISFAGQVAPILVSHCGKCHIQERRGEFSLASYTALMQGPPEGVVVFAGDSLGSRLIETIETGDMPRGGGKVPEDQLQVLKDWVSQGAKFDGPGPAVPLIAYAAPVASANPTNPPVEAPMVTTASGDETVSFARQVAPLLLENCTGCHLDAMQIRGGLNMNSLGQLMRGGDSGEVVKPGDGGGSLLVRKLRGMEGARMPAGGRPPLPDEAIQLISTWIDEGAKLDAGTADQPLRAMATEVWAKNATHEELAQRREEIAGRNWTLGAPENARAQAVEVKNADVFVLGNVRQEEAEMAAKAASEALSRAYALVPPPRERTDTGDGRFKGRITLFLLPRRYDYSEFAKMVESREIPAEWDSHWRFDGVDAYIALVVAPEDDEKTVQSRLVGPMASLLVASRGESPRWFREGIGRAVASKLGGRDFEPSARWDAGLRDAVSVIKEPKELIEQRLPPEQADLIGYGLAQTFTDRKTRKAFDSLLGNLETGTEFQDAFATSFQMPLENYIIMWSNWYRTSQR